MNTADIRVRVMAVIEPDSPSFLRQPWMAKGVWYLGLRADYNGSAVGDYYGCTDRPEGVVLNEILRTFREHSAVLFEMNATDGGDKA